MKPGFWSDYRATFRGPYGWTMWYATVWAILLLAALVPLVRGLSHAETPKSAAVHATGILVVVIWLAMIKVWVWIQLLRVWMERR